MCRTSETWNVSLVTCPTAHFSDNWCICMNICMYLSYKNHFYFWFSEHVHIPELSVRNYQAFFWIGLRQFLVFINPYLHAKKSRKTNEPIFRKTPNGQTGKLTDRLTDRRDWIQRTFTPYSWVQKDESINNKINFVQKTFFCSYDCKNIVPSSFFRVMNSHSTFKVISTPNLFLWIL